MTIGEMIKKYDIRDVGDGRIGIYNMKDGKKHMDEIKAKKAEIMAHFAAEKAAERAAYEARQAKINAIEGLTELTDAIEAEIAYGNAFNRMMEDEYNDGVNPPSRPKVSSVELRKQYPRAAAYIKAENWEYASHYAKCGAGRRAKERIINGEDYVTVLADMDAEWSAHCAEHMWD